jgi:glyoxylase-like metal-dependent hydrolase (beta-lactamase superfamily II)
MEPVPVSDIAFLNGAPPHYGESERLSPLVRRVLARNPSAFTYQGTGTYIVGSGEVAVIDPGPLLDEHLQALLAALQGERVRAIVTTHTHLDHSPLSAALKAATGATVYGLPDPNEAGGEGHGDTDFAPDVRVRDGQIIAGPGWTLEAIATPGHSSNHMAYALAEENALFPGDHVMGWSTTVVSPPDGDMGDYLASLDKVSARDFAVLYPTHGPAIPEPARFLRAYKGHRLQRERQVLAQLAAGRGLITQEMAPALYANVDPRLHGAAARSLWAHLIHLVRTGRAVAEGGEPTLEARYRLP